MMWQDWDERNEKVERYVMSIKPSIDSLNAPHLCRSRSGYHRFNVCGPAFMPTHRKSVRVRMRVWNLKLSFSDVKLWSQSKSDPPSLLKSPAPPPLVSPEGPGCSGVASFLGELGPFSVSLDGETLIANPYSWNKGAPLRARLVLVSAISRPYGEPDRYRVIAHRNDGIFSPDT